MQEICLKPKTLLKALKSNLILQQKDKFVKAYGFADY